MEDVTTWSAVRSNDERSDLDSQAGHGALLSSRLLDSHGTPARIVGIVPGFCV